MTDNSSRLAEFIKEKYYGDLINSSKEESPAGLIVDFNLLDRFDPIIADQLLEYPESVLDDFKKAASSLLPGNESRISVRIKNLPDRRAIRIRYLRSKHLNKLWRIDAIIKSASEVKPQIYEAMFECPDCHAKITVPQESSLLQKPYYCGAPYIEQGCGRRGDFGEPVDKKMFDFRFLGGVEPFELTTGERPGEITIMLKEDLTTPRMQKKTDPGSNLKIVGILKEIPKRIKGRLSTKMDMYLEANYIESSEMDFEELEITEEDEKKIKGLSQDPLIYEKLKASIAPGIYGFDEIKESIVLQLFGGVRHTLPDGSTIRGNIHILLTGDPGVGKTQFLKLVSRVVPRSKYVSGSGVTGAGLTASVIKNELLGSWVLEAGALILCNKGLIAIDEFDKMSKDDQIAMHEATSVESYHGDTPITLSNGEVKSIKELVGSIFEDNKNRIIKGDNCYFINAENPEILVTDFNKIIPKSVSRVSRHKAPEFFYEIILQSGKSVKVTPNHPCFVFDGRKFSEKRADELSKGDFVPIPRLMPIEGKEQALKIDTESIALSSYNAKHIKVPAHNSPQFCKFLGYLISEGSHEINRNKINGISFTNSNEYLLKDFRATANRLFGLEPYVQKKPGRTMLRYISTELKNFVQQIEPSLLENSYRKRIPCIIFRCRNKEIAVMLRAMFDGDGSVFGRKDRLYVTYTTASEILANQLHELLLRFSISSYIKTIKPAGRTKHMLYSVTLTGSENLEKFANKIGFSESRKNSRIIKFLKNKTYRAVYSAKMPVAQWVVETLKKLNLSQKEVFGHTIEHKKYNLSRRTLQRTVLFIKNHMENLKHNRKKLASCSIPELREIRKMFSISSYDISAFLGVCHQMVSYIELNNAKKYSESYKAALSKIIGNMLAAEEDTSRLSSLAFGDIALCKVKEIRKIKNITEEWVYDMTVPGEVFVSNGMVLHNTVSIAKASIVATLPAQTAVLAGANPKFGRFDPYKPIVEQIQIPETLLSRFDLKFSLRDVPNRANDEKLADHIMASRTNPEAVTPVLDTNLLRKYIAYVKRINSLVMNPEAAESMKNFYVEMRNRYTGSDIKTISITLRQYEALIRLAEASAKIRMDTDVRMEDAERAIKLLKYSLMQLGYDTETGRIDIDRIESGITAGKRKRISTIIEIIEEMQKEAKEVAEQDLLAEAENRGIENTDEVKEILDRLKREGTIFEPRPGFIRKV